MTWLLRCAALLALLLLAAGCGGSDDDSSSDDARAVTTATTPAKEPEPAPDPQDEPAAGELAPIVVTSPKHFATVVGTMRLAGTAQVHEGTINWAIHDEQGSPLRRGHLTASCGAPCRGDFSGRISLKGVPLGSWELHVWEPNVADDGPERLNEVMLPITVSDQRIEGAPEPDAHPPGGAPE